MMFNVARRMRLLTRRQAAAIAVVLLLGAAIGVAAVTGLEGLAVALLGVLVVLLFGALVQLRRRVGEVERQAAQVAASAVETRQRMGEIKRRLDGTRRDTSNLLAEVRSLSANQKNLADRFEFSQRRILASVENDRLEASDRQHEALAAVESTKAEVVRLVRTSRERLVKLHWEQAREVEALLQLFKDFEPRAPMPSSGRWALNPTDLLELLFLVERRQPRLILELGSGTSTVWMAYTVERTGGHIVSLDHDPRFAEQTKRLLNAHGLEGVAEVRHVPLQPLEVDGEKFQWYDVRAFEDVNDVDLLFIDGPPGTVGPDARYPALHVLESKLTDNATVILDDADRSDEQDILRRWNERFGGLGTDHVIVGHQAVLAYSRLDSR